MNIYNFFLNLKTSWQESLKLFLPKNLYTFLLVTLNSFFHFLRLIKEKLFFLSILLANYILIISLNQSVILNYCIFIIIYILLIYLIRPSIDNKDINNFFDFVTKKLYKYFFILTFLIFIFYWVFNAKLLGNFLNYFLNIFLVNSNLLKFNSYLFYILFILSPFFVNILFFLFDSQDIFIEKFKSIYRAFLILIYNYPFYLIVYFFFYNFFKFFDLLLEHYGYSFILYNMINLLLLFFIIPFYICLLVNYYIKRIHEQFNIYYN